MNIKHKLLSDYQFISDDKIITVIKSGTIIENYTYKSIILDKVIVESNPHYFEILDWKNELLIFMKKSKIPQPAILSKKLIPFINDMIISFDKPVKIVPSDDKEYIREKENELNIRIDRFESKEREYLEDLERFRKKEESYTKDLIKLSNKEKELKENQRKLELQILESVKSNDEIDDVVKNLEQKLSNSYKEIDIKELELDVREKNIENRVKYLENKISEIVSWKNIILNNWNYDLYPIPSFPNVLTNLLSSESTEMLP